LKYSHRIYNLSLLFRTTTVLNNNLLLYKIDFRAKPFVAGDSLTVSGAIYIQPSDYSIHKLEYSTIKRIKNRH